MSNIISGLLFSILAFALFLAKADNVLFVGFLIIATIYIVGHSITNRLDELKK